MRRARAWYIASTVLISALLLVPTIGAAAEKMPTALGAESKIVVKPEVRNPKEVKSSAAPVGIPEKFIINLPRDPNVKPIELQPLPAALAGRQDTSVVPGMEGVKSPLRVQYPFEPDSWGGIGYTGWIPPDCHMAAGLNHVVLVVNSHWAAYDKVNGARLTDVIPFADWFSNQTVHDEFCFDPKVMWDSFGKRWMILVMSADFNTGASAWLLSVSQTSDPTGSWWNYRFDGTKDGNTQTTNWADYPGFGFDKAGVYMTANMFGTSGYFQYVKLRILNKSKLYKGQSLGWYDFWRLNDGTEYVFTVQPAHNYAGQSFNYMANAAWGNGVNRLTVWKVTGATSSKPKLAGWNVTVNTFSLPPDAKQKGGGTPINVGDNRLLNCVLRNGKIYTTHAIAQNWGSGTVSAIRWYELQLSVPPKILQQGTYGANKYDYYYPSVMPDAAGHMYVIFNRSSANEFVSIRTTGRQAGDPAGELDPSVLLTPGKANYKVLDGAGRNRWGDYNGITLDPSATDQVWVLSEYPLAKAKWATTFALLGY
ncbi:MAG: hypothetical protein AB1714_25180 [Acidobacteriota bacterium]